MDERFEQVLRDHYLPSIDSDSLGELGDGRFVLFERGRYGNTWVSAHASEDEASMYTLMQEYGEDWAATALLDRETGAVLIPRNIAWSE